MYVDPKIDRTCMFDTYTNIKKCMFLYVSGMSLHVLNTNVPDLGRFSVSLLLVILSSLLHQSRNSFITLLPALV